MALVFLVSLRKAQLQSETKSECRHLQSQSSCISIHRWQQNRIPKVKANACWAPVTPGDQLTRRPWVPTAVHTHQLDHWQNINVWALCVRFRDQCVVWMSVEGEISVHPFREKTLLIWLYSMCLSSENQVCMCVGGSQGLLHWKNYSRMISVLTDSHLKRMSWYLLLP